MILLPKPQKYLATEGTFSLTSYTKLLLPVFPSPLARTGAQQLRDEALRFAGLPIEILCGQPRRGDIQLNLSDSLPAQGYALTIHPDGIELLGGDDAGLLHGMQTLRQIIRQCGSLLSCCHIEDQPAYGDRGFYQDVSRGRMPTLESLKKLADDACFFKLNQLQLYVEHTYLFRDLSEVWRVSRPLTAEEIMELDAYCADRGIELVPSLSCFGHLFELLHTKTYHELCELPQALNMPSTMPNRMHHHTLNITDPRSFALVRSMIDEFMPLFSSRRFNLCADETFDLGKGRGRTRMEEIGERDFYIGFVKQLCDHIVSKGRQPMFWGDIVVRFADALQKLPDNVICLNWGYSPREREDATRMLAQAGATQYVCPGVAGWNEWMNRLRDSYDNISRMAEYGRKHGAIGLLNTDWGDYGHINDPRFSLPGLVYGAALSWQAEGTPFDEINSDISRQYYLDHSGSVVSLLASVQDHTVYSWWMIVRHKEWVCGRLDDEESSSPLAKARPDEVPQANAALEGISEALQQCICSMDTSTRPVATDWLIAIEGVSLWNQVGVSVASQTKNPPLAARLENWFHLYEEMWRSTSHESELWRIRDVVNWYADELR